MIECQSCYEPGSFQGGCCDKLGTTGPDIAPAFVGLIRRLGVRDKKGWVRPRKGLNGILSGCPRTRSYWLKKSNPFAIQRGRPFGTDLRPGGQMKKRRADMTGNWKTVLGLVGFLVFVPMIAEASDLLDLPDGSKLDLSKQCPVCGMVVGGGLDGTATYSYRNGKLAGFGGVAAAVFKDGKVVGFEGARCLFIYNTIPKRFGIDVGDIAHRYVTDFSTRELIDVSKAYLVLGSNIKGFMGYDLIPFAKREAAEDFKSLYGGKRIVELKTVGIQDVERGAGPPKKE